MPLWYFFWAMFFFYFFFRNRNNENIFVWIVLKNLFFRTKKNISSNFTINRNKRKSTKWPQSFRTLFNSLESEVWTDSTRLARLISQTSQLRRRRINGYLNAWHGFKYSPKRNVVSYMPGKKSPKWCGVGYWHLKPWYSVRLGWVTRLSRFMNQVGFPNIGPNHCK